MEESKVETEDGGHTRVLARSPSTSRVSQGSSLDSSTREGKGMGFLGVSWGGVGWVWVEGGGVRVSPFME